MRWKVKEPRFAMRQFGFDEMNTHPLHPVAADETCHRPESTPMWSESWYFDFCDQEQDIGGWIRLGLLPNEDVAWVTCLLCGPQMPTIALIDLNAPLSPDKTAVCGAIDFTLDPVEPLRKYRVSVRGRGQVYDDPASLLRGEAGASVDVAIDMTWATAGTPYQYRLTSRYEIPCTASGLVSYGERQLSIDSAPGQRDHSWGVRDWWATDWVWSALHLDDGTHLHAVDIRLPGMEPIGVGYIDHADAPLVELDSVQAREVMGDNGLPRSTHFVLTPGAVIADAEVVGHAPIRLESPDGRVTHFPRAWVTVSTTDGRSGVGWVEWNRVQR
jgi:hypothetical protein